MINDTNIDQIIKIQKDGFGCQNKPLMFKTASRWLDTVFHKWRICDLDPYFWISITC
jgi:hypothetical protein